MNLTDEEKLNIRRLVTTNSFHENSFKGAVNMGRGRRRSSIFKDHNNREEKNVTIQNTPSQDMNVFLNYVMEDICVCIERDCVITDMKKFASTFYATHFDKNKKSSKCSVIDVVIQTKAFQDMEPPEILDRILDIFQAYGLLTYNSTLLTYYILNGNKRLSWKNIKQVDVRYVIPFIKKFPNLYVEIYKIFNTDPPSNWEVSKFVMYVKYLFWYFRKAIVDTTTRYIVKDTTAIAVSVGSTNVNSDYDITLYGSNHNVFKTINAFNKKIKDLFNTQPDVVFDTNMYGVSFIKSGEDYKCESNSFSLVRNQKNLSQESFVLQNIWTVVKVTIKLIEIQKTDETLHELLLNTLHNTTNANFAMILNIAEMFANRYEPSPDLYDKIVKAIDSIDAESDEYLNYISFVNYNGLETYFTMGAFLDVVVNGQMCRTKEDLGEKVPLSIHEYYDSTIENLADLMIHYNKEKYLLRVERSLQNFYTKLSDKSSVKIAKTLNLIRQITDLQNQCKQADTLITCSNFLLMNTCMQCIREISDVYFEQLDDDLVDRGIDKFETYVVKFPTRIDLVDLTPSESLEDLKLRLSPTKIGSIEFGFVS